MKKFAFLALLFIIYYIAGMFESPALMVVFLTQFLLMAVMLILALYLRSHLTACFENKLVWAEKDKPFMWRLRTENSGRLPVSRFVMKIKISQEGSGQEKNRKVRGSCECGLDSAAFEESAGHCGLMKFQAVSLKAFDYLSLFSGSRRVKDTMEVAVFPGRLDMKIDTASVCEENEEQDQQNASIQGSDHGEIRQIREYREGDPVRHIHWNQTARTGRLWVKEYEREAKGSVRLFLDPCGEQMSDPDGADGFYTLLCALLSGMLRTVPVVHVFWKERGKPRISTMEIKEEAQCRDLLFTLYHAETEGCGKDGIPLGAMLLTGDLAWYEGERLIFQFSKQKLAEETAQRTFRL